MLAQRLQEILLDQVVLLLEGCEGCFSFNSSVKFAQKKMKHFFSFLKNLFLGQVPKRRKTETIFGQKLGSSDLSVNLKPGTIR